MTSLGEYRNYFLLDFIYKIHTAPEAVTDAMGGIRLSVIQYAVPLGCMFDLRECLVCTP